MIRSRDLCSGWLRTVATVSLLGFSLGDFCLGQARSESQGGALESRMEDLLRQAITKGLEATKTWDPEIGSSELPVRQRDDYWSGVLQLTRTDNPMITPVCRARVATKVAGNNRDKSAEMLDGHIEEQAHLWDKILQGQKVVPLSAYLHHLEECLGFCGATVGGLIVCHLEGVTQHNRMIVLFDVNKPAKGEREPLFRDGDRVQIVNFAQRAKKSNQRVMLEARASNLGPGETLPYNEELAQRRLLAVRDVLLAQGIPDSRILGKRITWETPRLVVRENSAIYGFQELWDNFVGRPQFMDQSVVLLAY